MKSNPMMMDPIHFYIIMLWYNDDIPYSRWDDNYMHSLELLQILQVPNVIMVEIAFLTADCIAV